MIKRLLILSSIFTLTLLLAKQNIHSIQVDNPNKKVLSITTNTNRPNIEEIDSEPVFAALPSFDQQMKTAVKIDDARPEIVRQYLAKYNSPLEPLAQLIVDLSDQYDFDYRWMVAIAQQESNLCKRIPPDSHNCWGWGIYGDKVTRFDSFEDASRRIAPQFVTIFLKGDHTREPMEVMKTYTPPSDGSWANGVSTFFRHLE